MRTFLQNEAVNHHFPVKIRSFPALSLAACSILGLTGCNNTPQARRIEQNPELFAQLPPEVQSGVSRGSIALGYTPNMVFLALGRPDKVESSADGQSFIWTYRRFYPAAAVVSDSLYYIPDPDPLGKIVEMWLANVDRYDQLTKPDNLKKKPGETWQEYAKHHYGDPVRGNLLEDQSYSHRDTRVITGDAPQVEAMRLDVHFEHMVVRDAVINETISAFDPPPAKEDSAK